MKFVPVLFLVLSFATLASAVPDRFGWRGSSKKVADRSNVRSGALDTNAKRLAAGLPPLPARRLWSPTASAKRFSTSPVPHVGKLSITTKDGTKLGYISRDLNANGQYTVHPEAGKAAKISFSAPSVGKTKKLSLKDKLSSSKNATFFGAVIPRGYHLVAGKPSSSLPKRQDPPVNQADHITLAGVGETPMDSTPQPVPNTISGTPIGDNSTFIVLAASPESPPLDAESGVWGYDAATNQMSGTWINYDGSAVDTTAYYNPGTSANSSSFAMVSDSQSYLSANPQAMEINMNFAG